MPKARKIRNIAEIGPGCIIRNISDVEQGETFIDCVVLGIDEPYGRKSSTESFRVSRPYAFVHGTESLCPTLLMGSENFVVSFENLEKHYLLVVDKNDMAKLSIP